MPRHISYTPHQSAEALLDRPCFPLGQGLAQQSQLPALPGQVVSVFSLSPPWGIKLIVGQTTCFGITQDPGTSVSPGGRKDQRLWSKVIGRHPNGRLVLFAVNEKRYLFCL